MKLNHDCIRAVLLELEDRLSLNGLLLPNGLEAFNSYQKFGEDEFIYCLDKLIEAGFLVGYIQRLDDSIYTYSVSSITWNGHEYLDTIRDNKVWHDSKKIASKFTSVSLSLMSEIASKVILKSLHLDEL